MQTRHAPAARGEASTSCRKFVPAPFLGPGVFGPGGAASPMGEGRVETSNGVRFLLLAVFGRGRRREPLRIGIPARGELRASLSGALRGEQGQLAIAS
jgi:hypothetical protein